MAAIVAAVLWAISPAAVAMALGGLETSLAIFFEISLVAAWIWVNDRPSGACWVAVGVVAGLAALARIDTLILVVLLLAVQLWRGPRRQLGIAAVAAAVVVGPWWIWCTIELGSPLPSSGAAAHRLLPFPSFSHLTQSLAAGAISGGPVGPWDWFRARVIEHPGAGVVFFWVFVVAFVALAAFWLRRGRTSSVWLCAATSPAFAAVPAGVLRVVRRDVLFHRVIPCRSLLSPRSWSRYSCARARVAAVPARIRPRAWGIAAATIVIVGVAVPRTQVRDLTASRVAAPKIGSPRSYDATTGYRETIRNVIPALPRDGVVGGWQSGALSYFAPTALTVVNLDGVVNPDAVAAQNVVRWGSTCVTATSLRSPTFRSQSWISSAAAEVQPPPATHVVR